MLDEGGTSAHLRNAAGVLMAPGWHCLLPARYRPLLPRWLTTCFPSPIYAVPCFRLPPPHPLPASTSSLFHVSHCLSFSLSQLILLTDDAENRRKAGELGVQALGSAAYTRQRATEQPELQDLVAAAVAARGEDEQQQQQEDGGSAAAGAAVGGGSGAGKHKERGRSAKRQRVYEDHRPMSDITAGIKAGRYHQGALRWVWVAERVYM